MKHLAIFASGSGSNAEEFMKYFKNHHALKVSLVLTNKSNAGVIQRAEKFDIPCIVFSKEDLSHPEFLKILRDNKIDFIVLAGFLLKVPEYLIEAYPERILNIHPALLPKYGGKGMYGEHVHRAVLAAGENQSGITIHLVNKHYDEGRHIFQDKVIVDKDDSPESLAKKIHVLEHENYPRVAEEYFSTI
jgi:phosphoribosylglycinamide formyltransferase-1